MDLIGTIFMYLIGALFMTLNFEPEDEAPRIIYILFVFAWPIVTIWHLITDFMYSEQE